MFGFWKKASQEPEFDVEPVLTESDRLFQEEYNRRVEESHVIAERNMVILRRAHEEVLPVEEWKSLMHFSPSSLVALLNTYNEKRLKREIQDAKMQQMYLRILALEARCSES